MDALPPAVAAVLAVPAYVAGSIVSLTLTRVAFQVSLDADTHTLTQHTRPWPVPMTTCRCAWEGGWKAGGLARCLHAATCMRAVSVSRASAPVRANPAGFLAQTEAGGWSGPCAPWNKGEKGLKKGGAGRAQPKQSRPSRRARFFFPSLFRRPTLPPLPPHQLVTKVAAIKLPVVAPNPLRTLVGVVEGSLGPAAKFVPSSTHVFLVALLLAVLINAPGGAGGAVKTQSRRR